MLGSSEALVDILLYEEERKVVDPALAADEVLLENLEMRSDVVSSSPSAGGAPRFRKVRGARA